MAKRERKMLTEKQRVEYMEEAEKKKNAVEMSGRSRVLANKVIISLGPTCTPLAPPSSQLTTTHCIVNSIFCQKKHSNLVFHAFKTPNSKFNRNLRNSIQILAPAAGLCATLAGACDECNGIHWIQFAVFAPCFETLKNNRIRISNWRFH